MQVEIRNVLHNKVQDPSTKGQLLIFHNSTYVSLGFLCSMSQCWLFWENLDCTREKWKNFTDGQPTVQLTVSTQTLEVRCDNVHDISGSVKAGIPVVTLC